MTHYTAAWDWALDALDELVRGTGALGRRAGSEVLQRLRATKVKNQADLGSAARSRRNRKLPG